MPRVIAHRGASGQAYQNSVSAFRQAAPLGADGVELDIHATADGHFLVHHDAEVPGIGRIGDLPAAAFAEHRLPNGDPIPALGDALVLLDGLDVWVEVKTLPPEHDTALLQVLDSGPTPARYAVHGFDHRIVARLGDRRPELRRGLLLASYLLDTLPILHGAGADTLWMETSLIDSALVTRLHEDGMQIIAWTANDEREIHRLVSLEVDGICGNFPERICAALQ